MKPFEDDQPLVDFLRQHHPVVPPAAPDLESQILAMVNQPQPLAKVIPLRRSRVRPWFLPAGALATAGLMAGLISYRVLTPVPVNYAELTRLEAFMESNWTNTVEETQSEDITAMVN